MKELEKRRRLLALGARAVDYYVDTGLCVFCEADDVDGIPHDEECDVGLISGVVVDDERKQTKADERARTDAILRRYVDSQTCPRCAGFGCSRCSDPTCRGRGCLACARVCSLVSGT